MDSGKEAFDATLEEAPRQLGPYRLEKPLGAGGMGQVFRAFDERLQRPVAVKRIRGEPTTRPRARLRLRREALSVARIDHPNIVRMHDVLSLDGEDWLVMELVEGENLARVLDRGPLSLERLIAVGSGVADALGAAHDERIVHRDLKAQNIILCPTGRPKVLDFGLAKWTGHSAPTTLTAEGQILGTPHAMSPEQAMGRKVDRRSDLFSLGSLLYEMAVGKAPFRGRNTMDTLQRVCADQPPPLHERIPGVPLGLSDLVTRLLEKDPVHRPRSAVEVAEALRRVREGLDGRPWERERVEVLDETLADGTLGPSRGVSERRQVTVLCCELLTGGDSEDSLDPVRHYGILTSFETLVGRVLEEFGGHLDTGFGHRTVATFGYPRAHEDDARGAVQCAQRLVDEVRQLGSEASTLSGLSVRIGLHTGPAVILKTKAHEQLVLGTTVEVAEGLQRRCDPGRILISGATRRLVADSAVTERRDDEVPEGESETVAYRILATESASGSWSDSTDAPLVARDSELELLRDRFRRAEAGRGQIVLVSGEAGIGKSRLVQEFRRELQGEGVRWRYAQCSQRVVNTPLVPIVEMLRRLLEVGSEDAPKEQQDRLVRGLEHRGQSAEHAVPLLAPILGLPLPAGIEGPVVTPQKQRELTFELIARLLTSTDEAGPAGILVEDLHWADPSTVELLGVLIPRLADSRLVLLMTFRPEFSPPWELATQTRIDLSRLPEGAVGALIGQMTGGKALPEGVLSQILTKTDGVPLFVEELTRYLLESKQLIEHEDRWELEGDLEALEIPATLRGSLTARLDRMGSAKSVLQLASVIGREFSLRLLGEVSELAEDALVLDLARLVDSQLVRCRGFGARARYLFRHALIQDAAYDSLLKGQRVVWHGRVAEVLEASFPDVTSKRPEILAHHHRLAGGFQQAVEYLQRAGQLSAQSAAHREALEHHAEALEVLELLEDRAQAKVLELGVQKARAVSLTASKGYGEPELESVYSRSLELGSDLGTEGEDFAILYGLWTYAYTKGETERTLELAHRLLKRSEEMNDPHANASALASLGQSFFYKGDLDVAKDFLSRSGKEFAKINPSGEFGAFAHDLALLAVLYEAWCDCFMGAAVPALESLRVSADRAVNPFDKAMTIAVTGCAAQLTRDVEQTAREAKRLLELSVELGFPLFEAVGSTLSGWSAIQKSPEGGDEAISLIRQGLNLFRATGQVMPYTLHLSYLADAALTLDRNDLAAEVIHEAQVLATQQLDGFMLGELDRLEGVLRWRREDPEGALECWERSRSWAHARDAHLLELRTVGHFIEVRHGEESRHAGERARTLLDRLECKPTDFDVVRTRRLLSEEPSPAVSEPGRALGAAAGVVLAEGP